MNRQRLMYCNKEGQTLWLRGGPSHIVCVWQAQQCSGAWDKMTLLWSWDAKKDICSCCLQTPVHRSDASLPWPPWLISLIHSQMCSLFIHFYPIFLVRKGTGWWWCLRFVVLELYLAPGRRSPLYCRLMSWSITNESHSDRGPARLSKEKKGKNQWMDA